VIRLAFVRRDAGRTSTARKALLTFAAALLSLVIPALVIAGLGYNPWVAFKDLLWGALAGGYQIGSTLLKFAPLLTAGIGVAIAFRSGLWNIGNLGQFLTGGLGAVLVGLYCGSFPGAWLLGLIAGCLAGALWALLPGLLRVLWSINEVITTLMMNYIGVLLIDYLVTGPLMDQVAGLPQTARIPDPARLPILGGAQSQVHLGVLIAVLVAVVFQFILFRTTLGFELRTVGKNPRAAQYGGIDLRRTLLSAILISGALSGLAGAGEVLGNHYRLLDGIAGGYEYTPIVVALLGELNPLATVIPAFVFAGLLVGGQTMQVDTGLSASIVVAMEALIVLFVIGMQFFNTHRLVWSAAPPPGKADAPPAHTDSPSIQNSSQAEVTPPERT
jgi:general nucleoside transport system permease protein